MFARALTKTLLQRGKDDIGVSLVVCGDKILIFEVSYFVSSFSDLEGTNAVQPPMTSFLKIPFLVVFLLFTRFALLARTSCQRVILSIRGMALVRPTFNHRDKGETHKCGKLVRQHLPLSCKISMYFCVTQALAMCAFFVIMDFKKLRNLLVVFKKALLV